jgi:hypothetical protein
LAIEGGLARKGTSIVMTHTSGGDKALPMLNAKNPKFFCVSVKFKPSVACKEYGPVAARLGEMLFWAATLVVILILGDIACAAFFGYGRVQPIARVAIVIWLIGLACRYVLTRKRA